MKLAWTKTLARLVLYPLLLWASYEAYHWHQRPRYQDLTARQWWEIKRQNPELKLEATYQPALVQLESSFVTLYVKRLERSPSKFDGYYMWLYQKMPEMIRRPLPTPFLANYVQSKRDLLQELRWILQEDTWGKQGRREIAGALVQSLNRSLAVGPLFDDALDLFRHFEELPDKIVSDLFKLMRESSKSQHRLALLGILSNLSITQGDSINEKQKQVLRIQFTKLLDHPNADLSYFAVESLFRLGVASNTQDITQALQAAVVNGSDDVDVQVPAARKLVELRDEQTVSFLWDVMKKRGATWATRAIADLLISHSKETRAGIIREAKAALRDASKKAKEIAHEIAEREGVDLRSE